MNSYRKTVVVFGCTGTVGKYILQQLIYENCQVRGVLRNARRSHPLSLIDHPSLTYVSADVRYRNEVEAACVFADTVFLLTATHPNQVVYESNIIWAAKKCGIQRIVKLSVPDIRPPELVEVCRWHRAIEAVLAESGIDYCCLRPYAFMQNWSRNTFTIRRFGKIYGAMGKAPRNYVDARDVAEIAVRFLLQKEPLKQKMITITGPEAINHYEMANRLSKVTGRSIQYENVSNEKYKDLLVRRAKFPDWLADHLVELEALALQVPEPGFSNTEVILRKKPRLMNAYLQEVKSIFSKGVIWDYF